MDTLWWRRALDQRLGTLTAAAILLWTLGTALAASQATSGIAEALIAEREARAHAIAGRLDRLLEDAFRQLDRIAAASATRANVLDTEIRNLQVADAILRVAPDGRVLWTRNVADGRECQSIVQALPSQFADRHVNATGPIPTTRGPRVFLVLPARESDVTGGVLGAAINVDDGPIERLLASYSSEPYEVQLLDADGRMISASRPVANDHEWLIAQAPVSSGAWQIQLAEPRDQALAPVLRLRRILVGSSLLLIPFAVLVALAAAHSIRRPVVAMTTVAERLARGEFAASVPPAGEDEIGRLAEALEQLRRALEADERRSRLLKRVIAAQEEERRRIARELHDETTQQLTALAMQLGLASAPDAHTKDLLTRSRALVATMIDDVHRVIYDLRPSMLDDLGLLPAVKSYADKRLGSAGIQVSCEFPPDLPALAPETTITLYRVAQEALTNILRHARATAVLISCTVTDSSITLEVEDDGVGFEPERVAQPRQSGEGLGLLGMRERLALLGGVLAIDSARGCGTRVVATVPIVTPQERSSS